MNRKAITTLAMIVLLGGVFAAVQFFGVSGMNDNKSAALEKVISPEIETRVSSGELMQATFGAGCFWGVEQKFMQLDGVVATEVGYTGGTADNPSYKLVCSGRTGHAEAVRIIYDPEEISYEELLDAFFHLHNPTTPNRQGWDVGDQYRSAIFFYSDNQKAAAEKKIRQLTEQGAFGRPIVTQVVPAAEFWRAEEYHQKYNVKNGRSCKF